jgi:hypothetical protein
MLARTVRGLIPALEYRSGQIDERALHHLCAQDTELHTLITPLRKAIDCSQEPLAAKGPGSVFLAPLVRALNFDATVCPLRRLLGGTNSTIGSGYL